MKQLVSEKGSKVDFSTMEIVYLHTFVNWLYAEKDKAWEEYLELSLVQQNSLIAEFDNYIKN